MNALAVMSECQANIKVRLLNLTPLCASKFSVEQLAFGITKFPFHIGRDCAGSSSYADFFFKNDLIIPDHEPFQVSRKHCVIECTAGQVFVRDAGSSLGTIVNGTTIGVKHRLLTESLRLGKNTLILGTPRSAFKFEIQID
ncbi:MAG: FHA domain-containing protein [bacterium]